MADIDYNVQISEIPPPVPPKDDLRPMTPPKDYSRINFLGSATIGPSTSQTLAFDESISEPLKLPLNTFPGAKRVNKVSTTRTNLDSIFVNQNDISISQSSEHEPRKNSDSMFTKLSWWLSWGRLKPKNQNDDDDASISTNSHSSPPITATPITNIGAGADSTNNPISNNQNSMAPISTDHNDDEAPKVKKSISITSL